ncbi:AraC family transcriptional regulator [Saccharospirillum mangrovi]|uniref:AraC family transcriptional regulator n=1 Tax=Saccharospirillum mangrovi TaxID=2161747 RepID=UPI000D352B87|nr:AraC family transcriptional regulator [Saccharospirillum mangrovi]
MTASDTHWIDFNRDADTGIESLRAHFRGHAYDPHFHDDYSIGYTEQGVQQFRCRRQVQRSTPGNAFLLEPGEVHDGEAPQQDGFTYRILYLPRDWVHGQLAGLFDTLPDQFEWHVDATLSTDRRLIGSIAASFLAVHQNEARIVRDACLDQMLIQATGHLHWRRRDSEARQPLLAERARSYLHAHADEDIGLSEMAQALGTDRFRLSRAFKAAYGLAPHAYLIQWRLTQARRLLALGQTPAQVAADLGFADQSHLGRWFRRAYQLTPADYRRRCTGLPD